MARNDDHAAAHGADPQRMAGLTPASAKRPLRLRWSLASRLALALTGVAALVFAAAFYYDYQESRRRLLVNVEDSIAGLSGAIIGHLESLLTDVADVADDLAETLVSGAEDARLRTEAETAVLDSSYCSAATLRRDAADPERRVLRCQYHRATKVVCQWGAAPSPPPAYPETAAWSDPLPQSDADEPVVTYTKPVYGLTGDPIGAVSAELPLRALTDAVARLRLFQNGYAFIISSSGRYLAHPRLQQVSAENLLEQMEQNPRLRQIGERMIRGETGLVALRSLHSQQPIQLYFMPLPGTDWSVGLVFADEELFAGFEALAREVLWIGALGLAVLAGLTALILRRMTRPLLTLTEKSAAIAGGDLDVTIPEPRSADEIGVLTQSFGEMRQALRRQLETLAEVRAAQARIDNELQIARTIQTSFLPRDPAALAASGGLQVATWFQPTWEVGGDLFHCFWLADGRLFLGIGDVAGKGVPAALMMAATATLIKGLAAATPDPAQLLERVNRELCAMSEEALFVTLFVAALDAQSGELVFSNAGHNPPLIRRADGRAEFIRVAPGLALGVEADWRYTSASERLAPGDMLLLYTDGVTEAMDAEFACFEPHRLLRVSQDADLVGPDQWVEDVVRAVAAHVGAAEQSDDLTLLAAARPLALLEPTVESLAHDH